jgi:hypothetical protein
MLRIFIFLAALLPTALLAADNSVNIGKVEGAYRRSFRSGDTTGAKYRVTDTLEILRVDKGRVYFTVDLNFFNGHTCSLSGIAESEKGALVYRDNSDDPAKPCELRLVAKKGRITFEDAEQLCRATCGARGGYNGAEFFLTSRRKLTGKERQDGLSGYKEALEEQREKARENKKP